MLVILCRESTIREEKVLVRRVGGFCWYGGAGTSLYTWPLLILVDSWHCLLLAERVVR